MNLAEETALRVTIAYLFRHLPGAPKEADAIAEIMRGVGACGDDWSEEGKRRVEGIVRNLLSGGRDVVGAQPHGQ